MDRFPGVLMTGPVLNATAEMELILTLKRENEKLSQLYSDLQKEQQRLKEQLLNWHRTE